VLWIDGWKHNGWISRWMDINKKTMCVVLVSNRLSYSLLLTYYCIYSLRPTCKLIIRYTSSSPWSSPLLSLVILILIIAIIISIITIILIIILVILPYHLMHTYTRTISKHGQSLHLISYHFRYGVIWKWISDESRLHTISIIISYHPNHHHHLSYHPNHHHLIGAP